MKNEIKFWLALKAMVKSGAAKEAEEFQFNRYLIEDCADAIYGNLYREEFLSTEDPASYVYNLWFGKLCNPRRMAKQACSYRAGDRSFRLLFIK